MLWFTCPSFKKKFGDDVVPFKVNHLVCFSCDYVCAVKETIIQRFLTELDEIEGLEEKMRRATKYNCVLNLRKECSAHKNYCPYTCNCPNVGRQRTTKLLRYRRANMYLVMLKDKTTKLISREGKDELSSIAGNVVKALKIDYLLEITIELVPNTDDGALRKDNVSEFIERFGQTVLSLSGKEMKLKDWYDSSKTGEQCYVATEELIPVKRIKAINARKLEIPVDESSALVVAIPAALVKKAPQKPAPVPEKPAPAPAAKKPVTPPKAVTPPVEAPVVKKESVTKQEEPKKRIRRTREQLIADGYYDANGNKKD